jgi:hypothetical protein
MKGSTSMTIFDRFNIRVVAAGAGLCGVAMALSPDVAAAPLPTGGYACVQTTVGEADGASPVAGVCSPASAPLSDMAGIPLALPGPVPVGAPVAAPVPVGAPVAAPVPVGAPVAAPVPVGAPVAAPVPVGAPVPVVAPVPGGAALIDMAGGYGGKGQPTGPLPDGAPASGQPILPGPAADGAR